MYNLTVATAHMFYEYTEEPLMSQASRKEQFEQIEALLTAILNGIKPHLDQENASQIEEWIEVGEFGLAYERLLDILPKDASTTIKNSLSVAGSFM